MITQAGSRVRLTGALLDRVDESLAETDAFLASTYPGEDGRRQPVHTVYIPADTYTADLPRALGPCGRRTGHRARWAGGAVPFAGSERGTQCGSGSAGRGQARH